MMTYLWFTRYVVLNINFLIDNKSFIDKKKVQCVYNSKLNALEACVVLNVNSLSLSLIKY